MGRSPYEPPDTVTQTPEPMVGTIRESVDAEGYSQQYDVRGHPTNPAAKSHARQVRRAKNDVLSTMGIVVSGENGNSSTSKEHQTSNLLVRENDYGIAMATIDQAMLFASSWWIVSLSRRIKTFSRYTHAPLMDILRQERQQMGSIAFYFAGAPTWVAPLAIGIYRHHLLNPGLQYILPKVTSLSGSSWYKSFCWALYKCVGFSANLGLLLVQTESCIFSILQSLHILPPWMSPFHFSFLPFSARSLVQLPPFPDHVSMRSMATFGTNLLLSPFPVMFTLRLRQFVETRLYRLIRRRLPKPDRPDAVSLRIALENDLLEWTVPALGRSSDEELRRLELTFLEDLKYEIILLRNWFLAFFGYPPMKLPTHELHESLVGRFEAIRARIEHLHGRFGADQPSDGEVADNMPVLASSVQARGEQQLSGRVEGARPLSPSGVSAPPQGTTSPQAPILADEEQRLTQSPVQLAEDYFQGIRPLPNLQHLSAPLTSNQPIQRVPENGTQRRQSRSNTLFSRPSSPESSPVMSPLVRASLVHQNSEVITMQLELLQSNRNQGPHRQNNRVAIDSSNITSHATEPQGSNLDRAASELLDTLLARQNINPAEHPRHDHGTNAVIGGFSGLGDGIPIEVFEAGQQPADTTPNNVAANQPAFGDQWVRSPRAVTAPHLDDQPQMTPASRARRRSYGHRAPPDHRVTTLSSQPVDALASHLASLLTSVLLLPLSSLYLRSLASSFLSSPLLVRGLPPDAATRTFRLQSDILPMAHWLGGGSKREMLAYAGKLALITAIEAAVSVGVWSLGTAVTVVLGKRKFGWGGL